MVIYETLAAFSDYVNSRLPTNKCPTPGLDPLRHGMSRCRDLLFEAHELLIGSVNISHPL